MTRGLGGHSPANITHHLKAIHFPAQKRDLLARARENDAGKDILDLLEGLPEREFASIAEVMKETAREM